MLSAFNKLLRSERLDDGGATVGTLLKRGKLDPVFFGVMKWRSGGFNYAWGLVVRPSDDPCAAFCRIADDQDEANAQACAWVDAQRERRELLAYANACRLINEAKAARRI